MRQRHARVEDVDGPVQDDDDVSAHLLVREQGVDSETEAEERHVRAGSPATPAWLAASVAGKQAGDTIEHRFEMPADEAHALAGKACQVDGEVVSIKRRVVPELDDAFATTLGCEGLVALTEKVGTDLALRAERRSTLLRHKAVLGHLIASNEVTAPATLVDQEIARQLQQIIGGIDPRTSQALAGQIEQLRDRLRPAARQAVQEALVIQNLIDQYPVEVSDEEVETRIEEMVDSMAERAEEVRSSFAESESRQNLRAQMAEEKVLETILATFSGRPGRTLTLRDPLVDPSQSFDSEETEATAPVEPTETSTDGADVADPVDAS
jgi:trigger factor